MVVHAHTVEEGSRLGFNVSQCEGLRRWVAMSWSWVVSSLYGLPTPSRATGWDPSHANLGLSRSQARSCASLLSQPARCCSTSMRASGLNAQVHAIGWAWARLGLRRSSSTGQSSSGWTQVKPLYSILIFPLLIQHEIDKCNDMI